MEEIKKMCVLLMRRMLCATLKLAGSACFGIVLLLTGLSAFFFVAGHDVNPPDVSDLMPLAPPPIEQSENVVPVLMDATNCLVLANSDMTLVNFYRSNRYRRKYGSLPPTLEALVPEFLAEVPHDPFDRSRPLGYDLEQGTIHTVGAKGTFHGKIPNPKVRYGGLRGDCYPYIRRIDGQAL